MTPAKIRNALYPTLSGPRIDMWKEVSRVGGFHTFGYWPNGSKAGPLCPPKREVRLPILANGNYPGAPQPEDFYTWIAKVRENPELFTLEEYNRTFLN